MCAAGRDDDVPARAPATPPPGGFYLKHRDPQAFADRLQGDQIKQIREEERRQTLLEVQTQIAQLRKPARDLVLAAIDRAVKQERERDAKQLNP